MSHNFMSGSSQVNQKHSSSPEPEQKVSAWHILKKEEGSCPGEADN